MRNTKDRVVALDYFRGICILLVIINHGWTFTWPLTYITSSGVLWTSAAEMFFLISGLTLWVVKAKLIRSDFKKLLIYSWHRAVYMYLAYVLVVSISICLAIIFNSYGRSLFTPGVLSVGPPSNLLYSILNFSYSIGWASFLMYYAVFLIFAPFIMRAIVSKAWYLIIILSCGLFAINAFGVLGSSAYATFAIWQIYFVLGLVIGRFRLPILGYFYGLRIKVRRNLSSAIALTAVLVLSSSYFLSSPANRLFSKLNNGGLIPDSINNWYLNLYESRSSAAYLLQNNRSGLLRPLAAVVLLLGAYLLYQRFKKPLLKYTGNFINNFGRNTLYIFIAQALTIPILDAIPISSNRMLRNIILTSSLILFMWMITQRKQIQTALIYYINNIKISYYQGKNNYLRQLEDA